MAPGRSPTGRHASAARVDRWPYSQCRSVSTLKPKRAENPADFARELGVGQPTVKSWAGVLEASYVGFFLPPWFRHYGKRVVKTPKFYFLDSPPASLRSRRHAARA